MGRLPDGVSASEELASSRNEVDNAMRIAVTGGSGFIGSNLVDLLLQRQLPVLSIDNRPPQDVTHRPNWARCDLLDGHRLGRLLREFAPTHVIHLAARTDLLGKSTADYPANVDGVKSLMDAIEASSSVKRVIYTSSMLVCRLGYKPKGDEDYSPNTAYGESKVIGENLVRARSHGEIEWSIARPSSIWGPWFGKPYSHFFHAVLHGRFVRFGPDAVKTFGYVGNSVYQLMQILLAPPLSIHRKVFYLGDDPPLNPSEWAMQIARLAAVAPPRRVPLGAMRLAAKLGDGLGKFGIIAPMTTFRLNNMTTDNIVDLTEILRIAPSPPYDLDQGIRLTVEWIGQNPRHNH